VQSLAVDDVFGFKRKVLNVVERVKNFLLTLLFYHQSKVEK